MNENFETVIGIEVHIELSTATKIFCGCPSAFGGRPNSRVCPVCMGMPGALPVPSTEVIRRAVLAGAALNCDISRYIRFDRKNYFYPDNPQNYQISQLYLPICKNGYIGLGEPFNRRIGIEQIHMEEDAGKLIHEKDETLVDYNRAGVPLLEIVSAPDMRSGDEAVAYLEALRETIGYLEISDLKMQEGSMRADVNLSVRRKGDPKLGTRCEMKNLNSFSAVREAVSYESRRQIRLIEQGESVFRETRRFDEDTKETYSMRSKEDAKDYRYFPDPDLPPVCLNERFVHDVISRLPETRTMKLERYVNELGLPEYDAKILTRDIALARFFERTVNICGKPKAVSNYLMGETLRLLSRDEKQIGDSLLSPEKLAALIELQESGKINSTVAKEVFEAVFTQGADPVRYVEDRGLITVSDEEGLMEVVSKAIDENEKSVSDYKNGKKQAIGFLVGCVMKKTSGRADASVVKKMLEKMLGS